MAITINGVRFSYCHLFQPVSRNANEDPKYSTTILLPKSNTAMKAAIDAAIEQAVNDGVSKKWNGVKPPYIAIPIHDGDGARPSDGMPFGAECRGHWVFTASGKQAPFVVDAQVQNIINPSEVYSGMYGNVSVTFFPYNNNGKKGVGCGLNGVQKVSDGEPLSGRVTAAEAFQPVTQQEAASYGAPSQNYGYGAPPAQNGYGTAPGYSAPPANPGAAYGGNPASNGYGNPAPGYGAAQNGYGTAAGYGEYPQQNPGAAYGTDSNAGYGNAPGYVAYPNVDSNTGEIVGGGYAPSGMPVAGI